MGKIVDNTSLKDIGELAALSGIAFTGYQAFNDWKGSLFGIVSYKLATAAAGGTPPVSQISGVAGLSMLGLCLVDEETKELLTTSATLQLIKYIQEKERPEWWEAGGLWWLVKQPQKGGGAG